VELFSDCSGIGYINKEYLSDNYIGKIDGDRKIIGWVLSLHKNEEEKFNVFVFPTQNELVNQKGFQNCRAAYMVNGKSVKSCSGMILANLTEDGDLQIEFNIDNIPFNLIDTDHVNSGRYTEEVS